MKIYIQNHAQFAGYFIYKGYAHAWIYSGYPVELIDSLKQIKDKQYMLMITDGFINDEKDLEYVEKSKKCFLYASANNFPEPWGNHPNYKCSLNADYISLLNNMSNVVKWTFCDVDKQVYNLWDNVNTVLLAFDDISYDIANSNSKKYKYDVCFIGGYANNGFNEKIKIMQELLNHLGDSNLRCGFSVGQNISHELENEIIASSKIPINIHDEYQRVLGYDCNERTYKSLGINGFLISDKINQLNRLFPKTPTTNDKNEFLNYCLEYASMDLSEIKKSNRDNILKNHTYKSRVKQLLEL